VTSTVVGCRDWPAHERRDLAGRISRDIVAAYFGLHPSHIAGLQPLVVDLMAARLEGNRPLARRIAQTIPDRRPWDGGRVA